MFNYDLKGFFGYSTSVEERGGLLTFVVSNDDGPVAELFWDDESQKYKLLSERRPEPNRRDYKEFAVYPEWVDTTDPVSVATFWAGEP